MGYPFPSEAWLNALNDILNSDERYAEVAKKWEGDILFIILPDETADGQTKSVYYLDLWHGKCRKVSYIDPSTADLPKAKFVFEITNKQVVKILQGEMDAMQAMVTRKLKVGGDLGYMLRNVPVVLDFIRCCREVGIEG
jgi:putative sterol carrier protein